MRSHLTAGLLLPVLFLLVYCSDEDRAFSPATTSGEKVEVGPASKPIVDLTEVPAGAGWIKVCSRYDRGHAQEDKVEQCYTLDYFADEDNPDGRSLSRTNSDATGSDGWQFTAANTELCWYRYGADASAIASSIITAKEDLETCIDYNARIARGESEREVAEVSATTATPFTKDPGVPSLRQGSGWSEICGEAGVDSDTGRCVDPSLSCGYRQLVLDSEETVDGRLVQRYRPGEYGLEDACSWNCNTHPSICPVGHTQTQYYSPRKYHKSWNDQSNPNVDTINITGEDGVVGHSWKTTLKFEYKWVCRQAYGDATDESGVVATQTDLYNRPDVESLCDQATITMEDGTTKSNPTRTQPPTYASGNTYSMGDVVLYGSSYYRANRWLIAEQGTPSDRVEGGCAAETRCTATENGPPGTTGSTAWTWFQDKTTHKFGVPYPKGRGSYRDPLPAFKFIVTRTCGGSCSEDLGRISIAHHENDSGGRVSYEIFETLSEGDRDVYIVKRDGQRCEDARIEGPSSYYRMLWIG